VRLFDAQTGAIRKTIPHSGTAKAVAFSADGSILAIGGQYGQQILTPSPRMLRTVRLWDLSKGKLLSEFKQESQLKQQGPHSLEGLHALAFSPDGRLLATADADNTVRLLDMPAGQIFKALERQEGAIFALCFSPDGKLLVTGNANGTAKVWDVQSGKLLKTLQANKDKPVWSVGFSRQTLQLTHNSITRSEASFIASKIA